LHSELKKLVPIQLIYEEQNHGFYGGYENMIKSLGFDILVEVHDNDYQGDSRYLLRDRPSGRWGILIYGWGSCSGCDAFLACKSYKELDDLRLSTLQSIKWQKDAKSLLEYVKEKDWDTEFFWHAKETKEFIEKIAHVLQKHTR